MIGRNEFTDRLLFHNQLTDTQRQMTGVKLTERIRYIHCPGDDDGGSHGILVLVGAYGYPTKTLEVNDRSDFRFAYNNFRDIEARQAEMNAPAYA